MSTAVGVSLDEDAIAYAGVLGQARMLRSGDLTAVDLIDTLLTRIHRYDGAINSFRAVREDGARAEAVEAQRAIDDGDDRPLLGVPFAVKDNLDVIGETTEHGSLHRGAIATTDSDQVARMRAAGMICLGKTTMPELALWPFGENRATGITRNPYDLSRTSGGSSSGSAAAVAAGFVPVATATDGGGSIRIPAACSGLVGLKPRPGLVGRGGGEHWYGLSSAGVLTRTAADSAAVLDITVDPSPGYAATLEQPLDNLRVAWTPKAPTPARISPEMYEALTSTLDKLTNRGATVVRRDPPYGRSTLAFVPRYLGGVAQDADNYVPTRAVLEPRTRHAAMIGRLFSAKQIEKSKALGVHIRQTMDETYADVDVLISPTIARTAVPAGRWSHSGLVATARGVSTWVPFCATWNGLAVPAVSVPVGLSTDGLPLAVQVIGSDEATLLRVAALIEDVTGPRPQPTL